MRFDDDIFTQQWLLISNIESNQVKNLRVTMSLSIKFHFGLFCFVLQIKNQDLVITTICNSLIKLIRQNHGKKFSINFSFYHIKKFWITNPGSLLSFK